MTGEPLDAAFRTDAAVLDGLHDDLTARAAAAGLLDVAFRTVDGPLGELLVAVTPTGLVRVAFEREGHDAALDELARQLGPRILHDRRRLDPVATELDEYFTGKRRHFDVPVDLSLARGFRHDVLEQLRTIPFGATASYAEIARAAGSARAVRATGTACATNPVPVVVPCHRVVRSDGALGNYRGGPAAKRWLLDLEAAA